MVSFRAKLGLGLVLVWLYHIFHLGPNQKLGTTLFVYFCRGRGGGVPANGQQNTNHVCLTGSFYLTENYPVFTCTLTLYNLFTVFE